MDDVVIVVYNAKHETLITSKKNEKKMIKEWFTGAPHRNIDDYDRVEGTIIKIESRRVIRAYKK